MIVYAARRWAVRNARRLDRVYRVVGNVMVGLDPLWRRLGYHRVDRPLAGVERVLKGALFDCRMCGQCVLGDTGMSCPMNCPKSLRNGPCGGVREGGMCEVEPDLRCVWVEAWEGGRRMCDGERLMRLQPPVDHGLWGRSAWLRDARLRAGDGPGSRAGP